MQFLKKITFACLIMSFTVTPLLAEHEDLKEELKRVKEQERIDKAKTSVLTRLLAGIVIGGTIAAISRTDYLNNTAFGTGLLVSSIPVFIGTVAQDEDTQKACYSLAIAAPIVSTIGGALVSKPVYADGGLLANATYVNGDKLAAIIRANPPSQSVAGLVACGAVGSHMAIKSLLDRFSNYMIKKGHQAYDYVVGK